VAAVCLVGVTSADACTSKKSGASASAAATTAQAGHCESVKTAGACGKSASVSFAAVPYREGTRMELTGKVVCGSCDLNAAKQCKSVFQTADGSAYWLMNSNLVEKMRASDGRNYRIVSRVRKLDGAKYLDVEVVSAI
jgi:hypothetical protein